MANTQTRLSQKDFFAIGNWLTPKAEEFRKAGASLEDIAKAASAALGTTITEGNITYTADKLELILKDKASVPPLAALYKRVSDIEVQLREMVILINALYQETGATKPEIKP